jgi:hypothetical protein
MRLHNLFSLPHLPTRHTRGKGPLVDYFSSHVVTFVEYLNILREKTMDKVIVEQKIKEKRKKRINKPKE